MADRIGVPLELADFDVTECELVDGVLEVSVRSTKRPACHHCGSVAVTGHGRHDRLVRDRACSYPCVLRWSQRRFRCNDCGRTCRETHPAISGKRRATERFRRHLFERACREPFTDVAASEKVSGYRVEEAFEAHAASELIEHAPDPPRVLSLDESAFRKRFRFHTVFTDPERGAIIEMVEGRGTSAVFQGLLAMSDEARAAIETVVMDCHWPYRRAIEEALPHARIVADKFHVIRAIDTAAQRVRRRAGRRSYRRIGPRGGVARTRNPAFDPPIFKARRLFMKRANKLSCEERDALWAVLEASADELRDAWALKELFAAIYEAPDRPEAERRLDEWIEAIARVGIPEFLNTWRTLEFWREEILNYFDDRVTNAFAEGITNKIKVLKRRSYGFRNPVRYRQRVLLSCRHHGSRGRTHRFS